MSYPGYVGYDSTFALIWGERLASGESPSFEDPFSPTPHPLMNLVGLVLSPLGAEGAETAMLLLALAWMVLLGVAAFRLGRALFAPAAGVVFAALLLTRPEIVELALAAQMDLWFLGLVLLAAALEAERPGRGMAPLVLLAFAGLLRPEAWILSAAYVLYLRRPRLLPLAAAAPLLWIVHDLALTGDPLFSLHDTQDFADAGGSALGDGVELLLDVTGIAVALCGVAGWLLVRPAEQRRVALPAALFFLSVVPFVVYGAAGLTLYARFLLPAAAALAVLAAAAATGWARRGVAPVVAVALLVSVPFTIAALGDVRSDAADRARAEDELTEALRSQAERCDVILVPSYRFVPPLMHRLDLPGGRFTESADARACRAA